MGKFKMKGFKAFDMEKNSNNKPDGRAGSSVFQIAGKVYNKFSTSPNKIAKITSDKTAPETSNIGEGGPVLSMPPSLRRKETSTAVGKKLVKKSGEKKVETREKKPDTTNKPDSPMPIAMRSVGSNNRLKTRPVRKKSDSSDPFKVGGVIKRRRSPEQGKKAEGRSGSSDPFKIGVIKRRSPEQGKKAKGRSGSSDPFKIANQYRRHEVSKSDRADAFARKRMIDRKYPDRSAKERATLANTSQYADYGAKDEFKRMKKTGNFPFGKGSNKKKA